MAFTDSDDDDSFDGDEALEGGDNMGNVARGHLKAFVERIERLEEDKAAVAEDIKEVYKEVKSMGFDTKIMRKVISLRKIDLRERQEAEALLDLYMSALL